LHFNHANNLNERNCSAHPEPRPSLTFGASLRLSKFVPDKFVEPAIRFTVYATPGHPHPTTRTPLRMGETASVEPSRSGKEAEG